MRSLPPLCLCFAAACAVPPSPASPPPETRSGAPELPAIPPRSGALEVDVVYPAEGASLTASDSTFVFGSVGSGEARLAINGAPVEVAPNGAFLAFLPVPTDGRYQVVATSSGGETARLIRSVELPATLATQLRGVVSFEAAERMDGVASPPSEAFSEAAPRAGVVATARADGVAVGRYAAGSGTPYEWFLPQGVRLEVVEQRSGQLRVRLAPGRSIWLDSADVRLLPEGTAVPVAYVGAVRLAPAPEWVEARLATSQRLPFRVEATERGYEITVFGATSRTNWLYYGPADPLIESARWEQPSDGVYRLRVETTARPWGWLAEYDSEGTLVVRLRRPPPIDPEAPIRGLTIGVDAGHPPGGAIGPTRLTEAEANLGIARRLAELLEQRGARVLQTRPDSGAVALGERPLRATREGAHLLVSVHNNAFPDGVDPWENNGTSVFYNHGQSRELAMELQRELLREFGLRDLGVARADLALVRPTWMPAALTETMFLMVPRQEAALRDPTVRERIARAHLRGIEAFLRGRAAAESRSGHGS
ncbi:hypothetical protein BH23GEM4_BH23GEM4_01120 [soil metagenome]